MTNKTALIWGVTGQTGSYLAELLLEKGYEVIGVKRRTSTNTTSNITNILTHTNFKLIEGDIIDAHSVSGIIGQYKPNECYNLAAMSHVGTSFLQPTYTFMANAVGPLNCLEAIRIHSPDTKYYQASTSELLADNYQVDKGGNKYQDETTPLGANSPYGVAKLAAHYLVKIYREGYGLFACAALLHNHESERRGEGFVTRKITKYVAQLKLYLDTFSPLTHSSMDKLKLGNINTVRDWGYAPEYADAIWQIIQQEKPNDFMIATGEGHTIKEFLDEAFNCIGISDWTPYVEIDPELYRPCDVPYLRGCADKAKRILGWEPKVTFQQLVQKMVQHDIAEAENEANKAKVLSKEGI